MNYFGSFGSNEAEALSVLTPIVESALDAHQVGNYEAFSKLITSELATKITKERFLKAHREIAPQLGLLKSKQFLAALRKRDNPTLLYVAEYANTTDDVTINITFQNNSTPPLIDWIWIE